MIFYLHEAAIQHAIENHNEFQKLTLLVLSAVIPDVLLGLFSLISAVLGMNEMILRKKKASKSRQRSVWACRRRCQKINMIRSGKRIYHKQGYAEVVFMMVFKIAKASENHYNMLYKRAEMERHKYALMADANLRFASLIAKTLRNGG